MVSCHQTNLWDCKGSIEALGKIPMEYYMLQLSQQFGHHFQ